ncbi:hypothetical protein DPMN_142718 [Dreissena polymorpha]|uniref:Uncharacterized protein n=1 Tax=Dreissena polymorpha TaxID=45954 RepID=A0A9D4GBS8_DREPO|nr:hypothetical protein DPMN_142718 [Dreissena polymorpha]
MLSSSKTSVLSTQRLEALFEEDLFTAALDEMSVNIPFLYELLNKLVGDTGCKRASKAMIYAMILNSRNRRVSALQKCMTVLAVKCHADNKLLSRLNRIHITM